MPYVGVKPTTTVNKPRHKKHIFGRTANSDQHDYFEHWVSLPHTRQTFMCTECYKTQRLSVHYYQCLVTKCPYCGKAFLKISWKVSIPKMDKRQEWLKKYLSTRPKIKERINEYYFNLERNL